MKKLEVVGSKFPGFWRTHADAMRSLLMMFVSVASGDRNNPVQISLQTRSEADEQCNSKKLKNGNQFMVWSKTTTGTAES